MNLIPEFDQYGAYIWASYGLAFLVIGALLLRACLAARKVTMLKARMAKDGAA